MSQHNPFAKPRKAPKPRKDREYKDGRVFKADKSELRREVFERSNGHCEQMNSMPIERCNRLGLPLDTWERCYKPITMNSMHLAHEKHGHGFRNDTAATCKAKCEECHTEGDHGSKCTYRRRPGKVMTPAKAQVYWHGTVCFCDAAKIDRVSFCYDCWLKLSDQLRDDLGKLKGKEWLEALAAAETELMRAGLEAKANV
jgi:hypothetical protein